MTLWLLTFVLYNDAFALLLDLHTSPGQGPLHSSWIRMHWKSGTWRNVVFLLAKPPQPLGQRAEPANKNPGLKESQVSNHVESI